MGDKFDVPNHYHIVHLLSVLIRGCIVERDFKDCPPSPYELEDEPIPLPLQVASMFFTSVFIKKVQLFLVLFFFFLSVVSWFAENMLLLFSSTWLYCWLMYF